MAKPNAATTVMPTVPGEFSKYEVVLLNQEDPRAIINLVPRVVKDAIMKIATKYPDYLIGSEVQLYKKLTPSEQDDRLRVAFWHEYIAAQDAGRNMKISTVFSQVCTDSGFYEHVLPNPKRMAWILCKPEAYMMSLEASLNHGKNQIDRLMKMDLFDGEGNLKHKDAMVFLKAYEMLDNRVKGSVIQRVEARTQSVHVVKKEASNEAELKKQLEDLRRKQGPILDVTPDDG